MTRVYVCSVCTSAAMMMSRQRYSLCTNTWQCRGIRLILRRAAFITRSIFRTQGRFPPTSWKRSYGTRSNDIALPYIWNINYQHYQHHRNPIVPKMLIVHIFWSMDFAPFGLFARQKVQKVQKTDSCNPWSVNFQHFPHFVAAKYAKCGKFRWFISLWFLWILWQLPWFPHRYAALNIQSDMYVVCMLNVSWKEKAYPFICTISILDTIGFLKCLKCLLFMLRISVRR